MLHYKQTTLDDLPKIAEWIAADPAHAGVMKAEDFVLIADEKGEIPKGVQCIDVRDENGTVFYLRFRNALIVETQFPPEPEYHGTRDHAYLKHQIRLSRGLKEALGPFASATKALGFHALFFNSVSDSLISFFEKLGFKSIKNYFKADL